MTRWNSLAVGVISNEIMQPERQQQKGEIFMRIIT